MASPTELGPCADIPLLLTQANQHPRLGMGSSPRPSPTRFLADLPPARPGARTPPRWGKHAGGPREHESTEASSTTRDLHPKFSQTMKQPCSDVTAFLEPFINLSTVLSHYAEMIFLGVIFTTS